MSTHPVAFFDIGQTLGVPRLSSDFKLLGLDIYPYIPDLLSQLRNESIRLGIISNTGTETRETLEQVLADAGIYQYFSPASELLIYSSEVGLTKNSPAIFTLAAGKAGFRDTPARCIFVGEDSTERYYAVEAGLRVAPHPNLTLEVIKGETLRYVRLTPPRRVGRDWRTDLAQLPLVPLNVVGRDDPKIFAITSSRTAARLDDLGFEVDRLGAEDLPAVTELYLARDDRQTRSGFMNPEGQSAGRFATGKPASWVLTSGKSGVILALPALRSIEEVHFEDAGHGHNSKFLADPALLTPFGLGTAYRRANWLSGKSSWHDLPEAEIQLPLEVITALRTITDSVVRTFVHRYSGRAPLLEIESGTGPSTISSRHIHSADNLLAVRSLLKEFEPLAALGLTAKAISFTHEGKNYFNIEAELPGRAPSGSEPNINHEIVAVTAHLDSTAAFSDHPYNPQTDSAPGADDDASGVAAVLALARVMAELPAEHRPLRTLRFVLFNAEEHGLVGSRAYARDQAALGAAIVAVFQMDMIGYVGKNKTPPRPYEIHAGFPDDSDVEQRSVVLAKRVKRLAPLVSIHPDGTFGLSEAQIYIASDPAAGRSVHASFQERGYAACVLSEDFFLGPNPDSPEPQENKNYHKDTDTEVTLDYLADIARAVGAAAYVTAGSPARVSALPTTTTTLFSYWGLVMEPKIDARKKTYERLSKQQGYAEKLKDKLEVFNRSARALPESVTGGEVEVTSVNPLTMTPKSFTVPKQFGGGGATNLINSALQIVGQFTTEAGFGGEVKPEFVPDPLVPPTSGGTEVVNLHQHYKGVPIFQMTRTVQFGKQKTTVVGDNVQLATNDYPIQPKLTVVEAGIIAASKVAEAHARAEPHSHWAKTEVRPVNLEIENYKPSVEVAFGLPAQPAVLSAGKFAHPIPANLVMFYLGQNEKGVEQLRLGWQFVFTLPEAQGQYRAIVAADNDSKEVLYLNEISRTSTSTKATVSPASTATASGVKAKVYRSSPREARADVVFPLALNEYPFDRAGMTLPGTFPFAWCEGDECQGKITHAVRGYTLNSYRGASGPGGVEFAPTDGVGNDQKVLNIFYFCCYMHDFFYMLGFNEASGNFSGDDPVVARAHPGAVWGTANMATYPDGQKPEMNMGLVTGTNRHTAFDADVVFHEFTHGVTNRLVGGRMNTSALEEVQSGGMGEGWGDYIALTIQNFGKSDERCTTGDWVIGEDDPVLTNRRGIRNYPYSDQFPLNFGDLGKTVSGVDLTEVHNIGEIWCACLMHMHRILTAAFGGTSEDRKRACQLGWQIVVDSLKLMPANPSFLDARDSMLRAARDMKAAGRFTSGPLAGKFSECYGAMWQAFAGFGMGTNASSIGASVFGVQGDNTIPNDPDVPAPLRGTTVNRPTGSSLSLTLESPSGFGNTVPAELRHLVEVWDKLPDSARAMINGIVLGVTSH